MTPAECAKVLFDLFTPHLIAGLLVGVLTAFAHSKEGLLYSLWMGGWMAVTTPFLFFGMYSLADHLTGR